jgi:hypothetical protein
VNTERFKLCEAELPFAVFDVRGKSSYSIAPPEDTFLNCDIEFRGRPGQLVVIPSALINDELPFTDAPEQGRQRVDNKTLDAGAFIYGEHLPPDVYSKRVPYYSVTSKDLAMRNAMFGQSYWSEHSDVCWSEPTLLHPEGDRNGDSGDDGPGPDDPVTNPGCYEPGDVVEDFYYEVEMNDTEA